jgi:hypothetical protein
MLTEGGMALEYELVTNFPNVPSSTGHNFRETRTLKI